MADAIDFIDSTRRQTVESKWARYALAGAAVFGLPGTANAEIITNFTPQTAGPGQTIDINLNPLLDSITDFSISAASAGIPSNIFLGTPGTTRFTDGLAPLNAGDVISLANTTSTSGYLMKSHSGPTYNYPWGGVVNGSSRFLGVRFDIAGQQHLGWAEISLQKDTPAATVLSYGYETEIGQSIVAGATSSVPEPSSLALFAAGAAGLLALRRRRRVE